MSFDTLGLAEPIARSLTEEGYSAPTPIQAAAIPHVMAGRDLIGIAQTGTGKTAAFALPILNHLGNSLKRPALKSCRVLVLSPTRELSAQIVDSFKTYGRHLRLSVGLAIGGVPIGKQIRALHHGVDVLVATPGRLLDLAQTRAIDLSQVGILVLDEADRMLDMGFINDIRKVIGMLPKKRQTLLFSATMPAEIAKLASEMLVDPATVSVTPPASTAERVTQRAIHLDRREKPSTLAGLLRDPAIDRAIVFTRTKHGADKVVRGLAGAGIDSAAIHGNKSQGQRERALAAFRDGKVRTLVATDIAARGIDVDGVSHVINYDLPNVAESYVHRIGRTARAGKDGIAISLVAEDEVAYLRDIEKLIRAAVPAEGDVPERVTAKPRASQPQRGQRQRQQGAPKANGQKAGGHKAEGRNGGGQKADGRKPGENRRNGRPGGGRGRNERAAHRNPGTSNGNDIGAVAFMASPVRGR
jgi:ATP-dependent RNA helicase RhlE